MVLDLTVAILIILFMLTPAIIKKYKIYRWTNALHLRQHLTVLNHLYKDVDGFKLSRIARASQDAMEYTYGEIDLVSFIALISLTHPTSKTRFYDLGSGTGKTVMACALIFNMQESCGIELFKELHEAALAQRHKLGQLPHYEKHAHQMHFIHDNFLNVELGKATLIFINATALFGITWVLLNQHLRATLVKGTVIITTSKPLLPCSDFIISNTTKVNMSWGVVKAYIHTTV